MTPTRLILSTLAISLILAACQRTPAPTEPDTVSQEVLDQTVKSQSVESTGNPNTDLETINQEISDLDAETDFDAFSQTDLTE